MPGEEKGRKWLFQRLEQAITFSEKKYTQSNRRDLNAMKWCRIMVQACGTYGKVLDNVELARIQKDIDMIKEHLRL